jgi:hypothetical protein
MSLLKTGGLCARRFFNWLIGEGESVKKFYALISFSHDNKMYEPHVTEPYEFDNEELLNAWVAAGYIELVEEKKTKTKKAAE